MLNLIENMLTKSTNFLFFVSYQHEKPEEPRTQPETNPNLKLVFVLCNYSAIVRSVLTSALGNLPPPPPNLT